MSVWKKIGSVLGTAVMVGATLAGAALAQEETMDLGDYEDLVISDSGTVQALYVFGATAATADVIGAANMAGWAGHNAVTTGEGGEGEVTLTPITTTVSGVKRHIQFDSNSSYAYEYGSQTPATDLIGPAGWGSGTGVVNYLYSYNEKGPIYYSGTEYKWHEQVQVTLGYVTPTRDTKDTNAGDKYDEVFLEVQANSMQYRLVFDTNYPYGTAVRGKKLWFMGKEYTVISGTSNIVKLGASDSEVILTTGSPSTTIGGIDVTLNGVYAVGTGNTYEAKLTVVNGGTTETKFIPGATIDSIAGIEIYIKTAAVTTSGTNEGEAQVIVGAGILKLEDGSYLKLGDGTETDWQTAVSNSGVNYDYWEAQETAPHTTVSATNTVLYAGDSITSPNGLFGLTYNGITDKYGNEPVYINVDIMPTSRNMGGGNQPTIRVRTPDGDFISYLDNTTSNAKTTNEIWINTTQADNAFFYRNPTNTTQYLGTITPSISLTTANSMRLYYTYNTSNSTASGLFSITEPTLAKTTASAKNVTVEYNATPNNNVGKFEDTNDDANSYYVYYGMNGTGDGEAAANYIASESTSITAQTRDYYTVWGCYVDSVGSTLVSLQCPQEQSMGEWVLGTQATGTGSPITCTAGDTCDVAGTTLNVSGAISGITQAALPTTFAKLDSGVTSADKSTYTLVLVGGPLVNTLVNELQTAGQLEKTIGAAGSDADIATAGQGVVELVANAWDTDKYAIVVAGSDRTGTNAAANILAHYDSYQATLEGETYYIVG